MITNNNNITEWAMLIDALLPLLIEEAESNAELRSNMRSEDKSMEDCAKYVYEQAKNIGKGQKCCVLSDAKTLEIAIEYFNTNNENNERNEEQDND